MVDIASNIRADGAEGGSIDRLPTSADIVTPSGIALQIRSAGADDEAQLAGFFGQISLEDLRFRFPGSPLQVGHEELALMLETASGKTTTFLALLAGGTLVGTATLADEDEGRSAQVTVSIHAAWKGKGIARTLLEHTLSYAKAHGLQEVVSFESGENHAAINLEHEMGFVARLISASPVEVLLSKIVAEG